MNISLENWLRNKLQKNEETHDYAVATDTVRCWIDEYKQLSQPAVMCSSCSSIIKPEDKKHCFWDEDIEQGTPLLCFDCYMENETIIRDFGF